MTRATSFVLIGVLGAGVTLARDVRAQTTRLDGMTVEAGVAALRTRSQVDAAESDLDGVGVALAARVERGYLVARVRYVDGTLTSSDPATPDRGVADALVSVGVRVLDWLSIEAGPRTRAYSTDASTQRWGFVDVRLSGERVIVDDRVAMDLTLWRSVSGGFHESNVFDGAAGGDVGVAFKLWPQPLWARFAYRIDRGTGADPERRDTFEQLLVTARLGL